MIEPGEEEDPRNAGLADLLRRLAHEVRSPLAALSLMLDQLGEDEGTTPSQRELLENGRRTMRRYIRVAERLSLVSALESGKYTLHPHEVDLAALGREAISLAEGSESRREVRIEADLPGGPWLFEGDPELLELGLREIAINAIKNARRLVRVQIAREGAEARLSFEDDGQGVPEDQRENLFRRFVKRSTRSGLGIGLSIAYDVIAAHGGRLTLEDSTLPPGRPGTRGARFVVAIPIKRSG